MCRGLVPATSKPAGAEDVDTFEGSAGDVAIFDVLASSAGTFRWDAIAPDGSDLFDGLFTDRRVELPQTETYSVAGPRHQRGHNRDLFSPAAAHATRGSLHHCFVGVDSFTYTAVDGRGGSADATVTVTVTARAPVAVDVKFLLAASSTAGTVSSRW